MREFKRLTYFIVFIWLAIFTLSSCTCNEERTEINDDLSDDVDDDDDTSDDDDSDDDDNNDDIAEGWYSYIVDSEDDTGGSTSIAVDTDNKVHISYFYAAYGERLKYATNKTGSWKIFTIGDATLYTSNRAIALDSGGGVHIAYRKGKELRYATNASGEWQVFTLVSLPEGRTGEYASIALDSNNKAHISYFECGKIDEFGCSISDIKYITNKSGVWQKVVIEDMHLEEQGYETSIAVDKDGHVHMSYSGRGFMYATDASGTWQKFSVGDGNNKGMKSLAVDSLGKVHITYTSWCYSPCIKYATNSSGSWETFLIDYGDCYYPSIALDSQDKVHISYCVKQGEDSSVLRYATNKSGSWKKTTIDLSGDAGWYSSIAVDSDDYVHISYCDAKNKHLKYATNRPPK